MNSLYEIPFEQVSGTPIETRRMPVRRHHPGASGIDGNDLIGYLEKITP
jgi:hypothetical protein